MSADLTLTVSFDGLTWAQLGTIVEARRASGIPDDEVTYHYDEDDPYNREGIQIVGDMDHLLGLFAGNAGTK